MSLDQIGQYLLQIERGEVREIRKFPILRCVASSNQQNRVNFQNSLVAVWVRYLMAQY